MQSEAAMLLVLLCAPLVIFLVHCAAARLSSAPAQVTAFRAALLAALPVGSLLAWTGKGAFSTGSDSLWAAGYCALVYAAFAYTYFHFFNMSESARRIRILHEIHKAGSLTGGDIRSLYRSSDIIHVRLQRLVAMKALSCRGGRYSMNDHALYWSALVISAWRRMLRLDRRYVDRTP
jgi:hypothetical protein